MMGADAATTVFWGVTVLLVGQPPVRAQTQALSGLVQVIDERASPDISGTF